MRHASSNRGVQRLLTEATLKCGKDPHAAVPGYPTEGTVFDLRVVLTPAVNSWFYHDVDEVDYEQLASALGLPRHAILNFDLDKRDGIFAQLDKPYSKFKWDDLGDEDRPFWFAFWKAPASFKHAYLNAGAAPARPR